MIFQNISYYLMTLLLFSEKTYYINNIYCILVNPITNRKITTISNITRHFSGFTDKKSNVLHIILLPVTAAITFSIIFMSE